MRREALLSLLDQLPAAAATVAVYKSSERIGEACGPIYRAHGAYAISARGVQTADEDRDYSELSPARCGGLTG